MKCQVLVASWLLSMFEGEKIPRGFVVIQFVSFLGVFLRFCMGFFSRFTLVTVK